MRATINVTGLGVGFAWPCMASGSSEPLAASLGVALWQEFRCQMELVGLGFVRKILNLGALGTCMSGDSMVMVVAC